jgi:hypothetical protein
MTASSFLARKVALMLIPGISQVDPQTPFAGRSPTERPRRRAASPASPAEVEPSETVGDDDADDSAGFESGQGMTLAGAQAAYASS